jgi:hypothetical protein
LVGSEKEEETIKKVPKVPKFPYGCFVHTLFLNKRNLLIHNNIK